MYELNRVRELKFDYRKALRHDFPHNVHRIKSGKLGRGLRLEFADRSALEMYEDDPGKIHMVTD